MRTIGYLLSIRADWNELYDWSPRKVFVGKLASERAEKEAEKERNDKYNRGAYHFTVDEIEVEFEPE